MNEYEIAALLSIGFMLGYIAASLSDLLFTFLTAIYQRLTGNNSHED